MVEDLEMSDFIINENTGLHSGGGIYLGHKCNNVKITNAIIYNNKAIKNGGGIFI